jgi:hypothetical protein
METEYLSLRDFGKLPEVNKSHVTIKKYVDQKRLPSTEKGIPKKAGLEAWKNCRHIGYEKAAIAGKKFGGAKNQKKKESVNEDDFDFEDDGSEDPTDPKWTPRLNKARALVQEQLAITRKFDNEVKQGLYVLKSEVERDAQGVAAELREKFLSLPSRLAAPLENKPSGTIQEVLEQEINEILEVLHYGRV